jgi:hypothetical protein
MPPTSRGYSPNALLHQDAPSGSMRSTEPLRPGGLILEVYERTRRCRHGMKLRAVKGLQVQKMVFECERGGKWVMGYG